MDDLLLDDYSIESGTFVISSGGPRDREGTRKANPDPPCQLSERTIAPTCRIDKQSNGGSIVVRVWLLTKSGAVCGEWEVEGSGGEWPGSVCSYRADNTVAWHS